MEVLIIGAHLYAAQQEIAPGSFQLVEGMGVMRMQRHETAHALAPA